MEASNFLCSTFLVQADLFLCQKGGTILSAIHKTTTSLYFCQLMLVSFYCNNQVNEFVATDKLLHIAHCRSGLPITESLVKSSTFYIIKCLCLIDCSIVIIYTYGLYVQIDIYM